MSEINQKWLKAWEDRNLGFHRTDFHPNLEIYSSHWSSPLEKRILVPLCGKSLDMIYLKEQGFKVTGVELSCLACREFFEENDLSYTEKEGLYQSEGIEIYCGDLFTLEFTEPFDYVYDRASYVALEPQQRVDYSRRLESWVRPGGKVFLTTFYHPEIPGGPPFSISENEIKERFTCFKIENVGQKQLDVPPKHLTDQVSSWTENAHVLTRN